MEEYSASLVYLLAMSLGVGEAKGGPVPHAKIILMFSCSKKIFMRRLSENNKIMA